MISSFLSYLLFYSRSCLVLIVLLPLLVRAEWFNTSFDVMGTRASVELWADTGETAQQQFAAVESEMRRIESLMSTYIDTSEISAVNRLAAGERLVLSDELYTLIDKSLYFSRVSDGAFDISYASVGHLYRYRDSVAPDASTIKKSLAQVDWRSIELAEGNSIRLLKESMTIDLGGIAKGYAVDRSIALLVDAGVESAIVSAGGDSRMIGDRGFVKDDAEQRIPWMVGIKHPRQEEGMALRLPLVDTAISTSGDYERYFFAGDERVHHIINPKTGRSASGVASVTVIGDESVNCDVLSTTIFVLGVMAGLELIESIDGYDAVVIDVEGKVHFSGGLQGE